ncbi:MAG TPA: hypothetical protein VJ124_12585, partial [Pyrinomonadaceae bacterium]|nr:hypothetical protein [Pyrinomonadaceae bacterium]
MADTFWSKAQGANVLPAPVTVRVLAGQVEIQVAVTRAWLNLGALDPLVERFDQKKIAVGLGDDGVRVGVVAAIAAVAGKGRGRG